MTKQELITELTRIVDNASDPEDDHHAADTLLLNYIDDAEVTALYGSLTKWYS